MTKLGEKIAQKRKTLGMTQEAFAECLCVTRQTVSRWEAGTVMPDIDKISDIASLLGLSCDYLLKDEQTEEEAAPVSGPGRLLLDKKGKRVKISFFDGEADVDLYNTVCTIIDFEGNWMKIEAQKPKGRIEKLISLSTVLSMEVMEDA